jgi:hypothetical protein
MNVIEFPEPKQPAPAEMNRLGDGLETAFEIHRMIFNAMGIEGLRENPGALGSVLLFAMSQYFGPDLVRWAEMQFENVYGIDPYTFINHVSAYLD